MSALAWLWWRRAGGKWHVEDGPHKSRCGQAGPRPWDDTVRCGIPAMDGSACEHCVQWAIRERDVAGQR